MDCKGTHFNRDKKIKLQNSAGYSSVCFTTSDVQEGAATQIF